jgi:hypothetical protein
MRCRRKHGVPALRNALCNIRRVSKEVLRYVLRLLAAAGAVNEHSPPWRRAPKARSILELRALGKEVWERVDPKEYVSDLRDEWDAR